MTKNNRIIDVIIPAYNVPDKILARCLASIACQEIASELKVTIVDDASTKQNYSAVASHYKHLLDISILRYRPNGGPGVARQYGIDHTYNEYITFIDADDTFNGSFALKLLRSGLESKNGLYQVCVGVFDEILEHEVPIEQRPGIVSHERDMTWLFGKLYRRSFLQKNNIKFHPTSRANEDNGFNSMCLLCTTQKEQISYIPYHVYYWHENMESITRKEEYNYSYDSSPKGGFYGFVENKIYALKQVRGKIDDTNKILDWLVETLIYLYLYYNECTIRAPLQAEKNLEWCQKFYQELYADYENQISINLLVAKYNEIMVKNYTLNPMDDIIPNFTLFEFLEMIKTS